MVTEISREEDLNFSPNCGYTISTVLVTVSREDPVTDQSREFAAQGSGLKTRLSAGFFVSEQEITRKKKGSQEDPLPYRLISLSMLAVYR